MAKLAVLAVKTHRKSPITMPPPGHLGKDEAVIWRSVVGYLAETGELMTVDAGTIETYCFAVVRQRRLTAELSTGSLVDAEGKLNPLLRVLEATAATVKNLAHVLKLNPTARKGARRPPGKGKSAWDGVLTP
jgi:P27 family predicted phage terminase small subunit